MRRGTDARQPRGENPRPLRADRLSNVKADTKVALLSGGEKARLLMGLASFNGPHLLILDEPTNHLDIDSRAALIEAINDYEGAVILISHDRYLLDACADQLWVVGDGRVSPFDGTMDDYTRLVLSARGAAPAQPEAGQARGEAIRNDAARPRAAKTAPLKKRIAAAEEKMARLQDLLGTGRCGIGRARRLRGQAGASGPACPATGRSGTRACRGRRRMAATHRRGPARAALTRRSVDAAPPQASGRAKPKHDRLAFL